MFKKRLGTETYSAKAAAAGLVEGTPWIKRTKPPPTKKKKNYKGSNSGVMDSPITFIEGAPVYLPVALLRLTILFI